MAILSQEGIDKLLAEIKKEKRPPFSVNLIMNWFKDRRRALLGILASRNCFLSKAEVAQNNVRIRNKRQRRHEIERRQNLKVESCPVHDLACVGKLKELRTLIAGPEGSQLIDKQNSHGFTPLILASQEGHIKVVKYLIACGADVNAQAVDGGTALMLASRFAWTAIVEKLIRNGANPNFYNNLGYTALMVAAIWGTPALVETLIKAGANPKHRNCHGNTALDEAILCGNVEIAMILRKRNSKNRPHSQSGIKDGL